MTAARGNPPRKGAAAVGRQTVLHPLEPVWDTGSRVLLLGTMPSPKSREQGFYYGHPQNRFWKVLGLLFGQPVPPDPAGRREFLLCHHIALWDVLAQCDIAGAGDSTIRSPKANDLRPLLEGAPIQGIFATGKTAGALYHKLCEPLTGRPIVTLPSTSPANARCSLEELARQYRAILPYLQ